VPGLVVQLGLQPDPRKCLAVKRWASDRREVDAGLGEAGTDDLVLDLVDRDAARIELPPLSSMETSSRASRSPSGAYITPSLAASKPASATSILPPSYPAFDVSTCVFRILASP